MMRYVGAALTAAAGAWLGAALSNGLQKRVRALEECQLLLKHICLRISHLRMPLPLAMQEAGGRFAQMAGNLHFGSRTATELAFAGSGMSAADVETLASQIGLMMAMGAGDSAGVCAAALNSISLCLESAQEAASKNSKLYQTLGICGGAAVAVLLL